MTATLQASHENPINERAQAWYENNRRHLETPENIGKLVVLDVASGDYEIDDEKSSGPTRRLQARHPSARLFALRIGYKTAASFCGALEQLEPAETVSRG